MTTLITLLLVLCISLLFLAGADIITRHNLEMKYFEENSIQFQDRLDKLVVLMCTSGCCIAIYGGNNDTFLYGLFFFNVPVLFLVLLAVLSKPAMNEVYLIIISYFVLITFLTLEVRIFFFFYFCI